MGQIVIEIPTPKKRRYILNYNKTVKEFLDALDASAASAAKLSINSTREF